MSMVGPNVIKDKPVSAATHQSKTNNNTNTTIPSGSEQLSKLPKNAEVTVVKHPSSEVDDNIPEPVNSGKSDTDNKITTNEFMTVDDSEFGATQLKTANKSHNLQSPQPIKSGNNLETTKDFLDASSAETEVQNKNSEDENLEIAETAEHAEKDEESNEDEKSAAELVAAAAAQIANKTMKKHVPATTVGTTKKLKATGKLLASRKQEQIMKKAMLMLNESGKLNVVTEETGPSIIKLNTPVNKAQIKLRAFRQNFEKQLIEMRHKTPLQIQALKAELSNIEFAEIGNKNIITGLLELVDDHELKLLTIEKMLKHGEITLSF